MASELFTSERKLTYVTADETNGSATGSKRQRLEHETANHLGST